MTDLDSNQVVVAVRYHDEILWYKTDRDLWVMDVNKWRNEFLAHGHEVPPFNSSYRFGIHVVNQDSVKQFLDCISEFKIEKDALSLELAKRFTTANSWWDVSDLFPIMFVNFDKCKVGAFYSEGTPMERYIPDSWEGEFIDFANEYPEEIFPVKDKFWIKGDSDLLKVLNDRGAKLE